VGAAVGFADLRGPEIVAIVENLSSDGVKTKHMLDRHRGSSFGHITRACTSLTLALGMINK